MPNRNIIYEVMIMDGWLGIRSGVQANMNIESFKVQVYQTIQIPYTVVKDLIEHRIEKDNSNLSRNTPRTYNKLSIIKELREVYNLGLNSMGVRFHVNHAKVPNIAVNNNTIVTSGYNPFITLREIKKDEELFWDYTISNGDNILNQFNFIKNE